MALVLAACSGGEGGGEPWVSSWASSMAETGPAFQDETVRQVAYLSLGGDRLRIRLSNVFGTNPARIGMASVGIQDDGPSIVPDTLRSLTFDGSRSVSIEPGAEVRSDPVELEVDPRTNVVVSLYLESDSAASTSHRNGHRTAFLADGNQVDALELAPRETTTSRYWLTGIDVHASTRPVAIVALGDSITEGSGSTTDANARYPDVLARELAPRDGDHAVVNTGIGGNRVLTDGLPGLGMGPSALERFERDVLSQPGVTHVLVLEGANDLGMGATLGPEVSPEELIEAYQTLIRLAHDEGLPIYFGTILPFRDNAYPSYGTAENEAKRQTINDWIRTTADHDGFVDFDEAMRDPANPEYLLPEYDSGDGLHPNDAGYQRMGEAAAEALPAL